MPNKITGDVFACVYMSIGTINRNRPRCPTFEGRAHRYPHRRRTCHIGPSGWTRTPMLILATTCCTRRTSAPLCSPAHLSSYITSADSEPHHSSFLEANEERPPAKAAASAPIPRSKFRQSKVCGKGTYRWRTESGYKTQDRQLYRGIGPSMI